MKLKAGPVQDKFNEKVPFPSSGTNFPTCIFFTLTSLSGGTKDKKKKKCYKMIKGLSYLLASTYDNIGVSLTFFV